MKSSSTQRPSRAPSRRTGLVPAARIFSSTLSTMALTWRSLAADAMTKQSVITNWSDTSSTITSCASLSAAAAAATNANSRAFSVAVTSLLITGLSFPTGRARIGYPEYLWSAFGLAVQAALGDVLDDTVRDQVPDGFAGGDAVAATRGGDGHGRDLDQGDRAAGEVFVVESVAGPG